MGKFAAEEVLDGLLDVIAGSTEMMACEGQPTDYVDATTLKLTGKRVSAIVPMTPADLPKSSVALNRKIDVAQKTGVAVDYVGSSTPDHVALCIGGGTDILYEVTTVSSPPTVTQADTLTFDTWAILVTQPT